VHSEKSKQFLRQVQKSCFQTQKKDIMNILNNRENFYTQGTKIPKKERQSSLETQGSRESKHSKRKRNRSKSASSQSDEDERLKYILEQIEVDNNNEIETSFLE